MLTKKQDEILSDIEVYNILAKAIANDININRPDVLEFVLKKQNALISDFMDLEERNNG